MIEQREGIWWPAQDRECWNAINDTRDLETVLKEVNGRTACLQAGGNCGIWAKRLAKEFSEVWTIEADFENYLCLVRNLSQTVGVHPIWAALSNIGGSLIDFTRYPLNVGGNHIGGGDIGNLTMQREFNRVPTLTIDELQLPVCDLLVLDIEGAEPLALEGAREMIARCKPAIMVEDRGISQRYGFGKNWSHQFPSYMVKPLKMHRDTILVPIEQC